MNSFEVKIYNEVLKVWEDYTRKAVFPLKKAEFLDERLDEVQLTLKHIKREYFNPLTLVKIAFNNSPEAKYLNGDLVKNRSENKDVDVWFNPGTNRIIERLEQTFIVSSDNGIENPIGSGLYNHEIRMIESTKIMEGFIGDSITFTNVLGSVYGSKGQTPLKVYAYSGENLEDTYENIHSLIYSPVSQKDVLPAMLDFVNDIKNALNLPNMALKKTPTQYVKVTRIADNKEVYKQEYVFDDNDDMLSKTYRDGDLKLTINRGNYYDTPRKEFTIPEIPLDKIDTGIYEIEYYFLDEWDNLYYKAVGTFALVKNHYPLKKFTAIDVVNRIFDTIEPLRSHHFGSTSAGDNAPKPRFRLKDVIYDDVTGNAIGFKTSDGGYELTDTSATAQATLLRIINEEGE